MPSSAFSPRAYAIFYVSINATIVVLGAILLGLTAYQSNRWLVIQDSVQSRINRLSLSSYTRDVLEIYLSAIKDTVAINIYVAVLSGLSLVWNGLLLFVGVQMLSTGHTGSSKLARFEQSGPICCIFAGLSVMWLAAAGRLTYLEVFNEGCQSIAPTFCSTRRASGALTWINWLVHLFAAAWLLAFAARTPRSSGGFGLTQEAKADSDPEANVNAPAISQDATAPAMQQRQQEQHPTSAAASKPLPTPSESIEHK
ncbi:unnamed protein product [Parajaminaea phylloscopi]